MHSGAARKPRSPTSTAGLRRGEGITRRRSEEHTSELQSQSNLVCRLLLEKKKKQNDHAVIVERLPAFARRIPTTFKRSSQQFGVPLIDIVPFDPRLVCWY